MGWGSLRRAAALALAWAARARADDERPHIVLAVVDDLGWSDVGYQGSGDLGGATPQLDALAAGGVAFEALYGAAECTPSRAMLLTGRHAVALGLQDSVIHGTEPLGLDLTRDAADKLGARGGTSAVGKWHLGFHTPKYPPRRRGFDSFFGILTGGGDHFATDGRSRSRPLQPDVVDDPRRHGAEFVGGRRAPGADAFAGYDGVHTTALYAERR
ncbi:sulfuric ester hydrolase [Aureococcus anophagefferens]|nr:sulfuric ester hydrolase [Aureococcus anophagefferens]